MNKTLMILVALAAAFLLGGCIEHEHYRHGGHRDVIVVAPEHHGHPPGHRR